MTDPAANVDRLIEKLPPDSLARELVSRLRETAPDQWAQVLKGMLEERVQQKVKELDNAQDQSARD